MNKFIVVRVLNGDVLREGEVNGTVRGGERGELDGVDGDNGLNTTFHFCNYRQIHSNYNSLGKH